MNFSESVEKIVNNERIALEGFYDRLFDRYPHFEKYFSNSNLRRQAAMLTVALVGVKQHPQIHAPARAYLEVLGKKHCKQGIAKELYAPFIEVLVEEVAAFHGDDWNDSLNAQWTEALKMAVTQMHEGYQE